MAQTSKPLSQHDYSQAIQGSYNEVDKTLSVNGFIVGKVGHKVTLAIATTLVLNDTEVYTFLDGATVLYEITIVYTDGTRALMVSAERTA